MNNTLNPKLFDLDTKKLKEKVRDKILKIANTFEEYIEIPIRVIDVRLVGSNAAYNYTEHSDIDIHLVVNFDELSTNTDLVQVLFNSEKRSFNDTYDITIKGLEAEVYVEDINTSAVSNGIYSVSKDYWIKFPHKTDDSIVLPDISKLYAKYKDKCESLLNDKDVNEETVSNLIDDIYMLRKNGLSKSGEFSKGNLTFKQLRTDGYLDKLFELKNKIISKQLSLEKLNLLMKKGE